jgi:hypothetical protein
MSIDLKISDRLQYFIGAIVSIVLISGYLVLSESQEETESPSAETEHVLSEETDLILEDPEVH